ncbi:MAG: STAS domain-containing protein, partial [Planctomycetota bacterium]
MHINVEPRETHAILHLRGEFDTYYCPMLQEEVDQLIKAGMTHAVLNLRLVKFINSTALGAIIKANKELVGAGGKLVISRPSPFCRDIIEKVGLNRVVPVFDTDEEAAANFTGGEEAPQAEGPDFEEDRSSVLFSPLDQSRIEHFIKAAGVVNPVHGHDFGKKWSGVGRMAALDADRLAFTWSGGNTSLEAFAMAQFLAIGTDWKVKFRLPLLQRGYCEAVMTIEEVEERADSVRVGAAFKDIDEETRDAVSQYGKDLAYLK